MSNDPIIRSIAKKLAENCAASISALGFDVGISIWEPNAPTSIATFDIHRRADTHNCGKDPYCGICFPA